MSISPDLIGGYSLYYRDFFAISLLYSFFLVPLQPVKKSYRLLYAILLLLLFGCIGHRYPQALLDADSLMADHSDSAVAILNQIAPEMSTASESVRRYYQLLRIEADDKTDKIDISPDSIKDLVHYYEEDGDEAMLPKAYYYAGRVYSDLNEAPISLSYFQKSLKAMEDNGTNDLHLQSVIYSQMGYLYLFQYIYDEAEQCFRASYEIGVKTNDTISIFWGLRDIGATYHWQEKYSESLIYFNKAKEIATKANNLNLKVNISKDIAYVLNSTGDYAGALYYMHEPMKHLNILDSNLVLSLLSNIYYNANEIDSFLKTAGQIEQIGDVFSKEKAFDRLTKYYLKSGDINKARTYYEKYKQYNDSCNALTKSGELQKVNSIYRIKKEEAKNSQLERQKLIQYFFLFVLFIGLLALTTYIYSYRKKTYERFKRFRILQREIQYKREVNKKTEEDNCEHIKKVIKSSSIYVAIINKAQSSSKINDCEWQQIEDILNENYPNFKNRLLDIYDFSSHEYHLCLLIKMGIAPVAMASLTSRSISAVSQARKRLYKKCFGVNGAAELWDDFIRSL